MVQNKKVNSRADFIELVNLLCLDFKDNPEKWENKDLGSFLEALGAYANDIQGHYNNMGENTDANVPTWQIFAHILLGARIYE